MQLDGSRMCVVRGVSSGTCTVFPRKSHRNLGGPHGRGGLTRPSDPAQEDAAAIFATLCCQQEEDDVSDIDFNGAMWAVVRGKCSMDEFDCIMSPGFPEPYPSKESCLIAVNVTDAVPIRVENFSTEPSFDFLSFDCQAFSGDIGPDGIVPDASIHWASDHSIAGTGWRLCPSF